MRRATTPILIVACAALWLPCVEAQDSGQVVATYDRFKNRTSVKTKPMTLSDKAGKPLGLDLELSASFNGNTAPAMPNSEGDSTLGPAIPILFVVTPTAESREAIGYMGDVDLLADGRPVAAENTHMMQGGIAALYRLPFKSLIELTSGKTVEGRVKSMGKRGMNQEFYFVLTAEQAEVLKSFVAALTPPK